MKTKTVKLRSATVCAAALLAFLPKAESFGNLKDVSKPYLGFYECESAQLGDIELTDYFEYIRVELAREGELVVHYKDKFGRMGNKSIGYEYDEKENAIVLLSEDGGRKSFPFENGELRIAIPYGEQLFTATFSR